MLMENVYQIISDENFVKTTAVLLNKTENTYPWHNS